MASYTQHKVKRLESILYKMKTIDARNNPRESARVLKVYIREACAIAEFLKEKVYGGEI